MKSDIVHNFRSGYHDNLFSELFLKFCKLRIAVFLSKINDLVSPVGFNYAFCKMSIFPQRAKMLILWEEFAYIIMAQLTFSSFVINPAITL